MSAVAARLWHGVRRVPGLVGLLLIRGYQLVISPLLPASCRYYPSCSNYALLAVRRHGLIWGSLLACWRLLRCNPWTAGGVDDVPEQGWRAVLRRGSDRGARRHDCAGGHHHDVPTLETTA